MVFPRSGELTLALSTTSLPGEFLKPSRQTYTFLLKKARGSAQSLFLNLHSVETFGQAGGSDAANLAQQGNTEVMVFFTFSNIKNTEMM